MSRRAGFKRDSLPPGHNAFEGEDIMVLDNEALIALGFLGAILVVTVGLLVFVVKRISR